MKKWFENELEGDAPIIILSYNNANGNHQLGNHIRLYTGYYTDDYDDDKPGFVYNINDYHFKTFDIIKELFPDTKEVLMYCAPFYMDNMTYVNKETECEGYKFFACADGEYSESVREDSFYYVFRTNKPAKQLHGTRVMDYTVFVDETEDLEDIYDRYKDIYLDEPLFNPIPRYYLLSKEEFKERKKQFKKYRLNKEYIRDFDFYYQAAINSDYYIGYDDTEDFTWCEMEDDRYDFNDAQLKVHYGEKFYLFKLNKAWTDHGLDKSYYFLKFTTDKHEAEELYNKPLEYFIPYISMDADGEPFTDAYHGIQNINSDDWKCEYELTEYVVEQCVEARQLNTDKKTITIKEAGH